MAVRTREEIITQVRARIGDNTDDESIAFLEDITDTLSDLETRANGEGTDWKAKYEENDAEWRKKYTDRFFNSGNENNFEKNENEEEGKPLSYDSLFKEC